MNMDGVIIVWLLCFSPITTTYGHLTNVALLKETNQSSSFEGPNSHLAVDGNVNGTFNAGSCTHTDPGRYDDNPAWEVDLSNIYIIENIKVYNRIDECCSDRLSNFAIDVSTDHVTYTQFGYHPGAIGTTYVFYPQSPVVVGRWVRVSKVGHSLSMCEVEIMSNMTHEYDYLKKVRGHRGTGNVLATRTVVSLSQCVFVCQQTENCHSVNIRQDLTSSPEAECQLLDNVTHETSSDPTITFWTMATVI